MEIKELNVKGDFSPTEVDNKNDATLNFTKFDDEDDKKEKKEKIQKRVELRVEMI